MERSSAKVEEKERLLPKGTSAVTAEVEWRFYFKKSKNTHNLTICCFSYQQYKQAQPVPTTHQ
jgi:hypothetical protein